MIKKLTKKQKEFADKFIETGNGAEAAREAYNIGGKGGDDVQNVSSTIASENIRKPNIKGYLESEADEAKNRIVELSKLAENESVRLSANKDICDRTHGKSAQSMDITTAGESFNPTGEEKKSIGDKLKGML